MNSKATILAESCGLPHLPDELIVNILSRLPVKSLLKFRCVSKSWLSLISSPQFIKTHRKLSSTNLDYTHYWLIAFDTYHIKYCSFQHLLREAVREATNFDDSPIKCYSRSASIVGSCNGLICIALDCNDVYLWNPSTRRSKKLPGSGFVKQHTSYTLFGFGYNELGDDYNVVAIFCALNGLRTMVKVYSLKTNSWRWIDDVPGYFPFSNSGKFVKGKLHWAGFRGRHDRGIISFDLSIYRFGQIEMPNRDDVTFCPRLGVAEDSLYVTFENPKNSMNIWVMKKYGERDSWQNIVMIATTQRMPLCVWRFSSKDEFCLLFGDTFSVYNPEGMLLRHDNIMNVSGCFDAIIYVESLVSP